MKYSFPTAAGVLLAFSIFCFVPSTPAQDRPGDDHHAQDRDSSRPQDHHGPQGPDRDPHHAFVRHDDWRKGAHMPMNDWNRGSRLDYRAFHLNRPPRGYEWREIDGNYVLAAITSGVIFSIMAASH